MARHPVKPDVAIYLPNRKPKEAPKKNLHKRRREHTAEEMVVILRKRVRFLTALVLILIMMLSAAAAGVWFAYKQGAGIKIPNIGQNFQTSDQGGNTQEGD
jgi:hypothetical protein